MPDAFIYDHVRTPRGRGNPTTASGQTPIDQRFQFGRFTALAQSAQGQNGTVIPDTHTNSLIVTDVARSAIFGSAARTRLDTWLCMLLL